MKETLRKGLVGGGFAAVVLFGFTGCVTKQTVTDHKGQQVDEKYIIHRPVKKFIQNAEFE